MAKHRFYIPAADWNPEKLVLSDEEAHHCLDVMRCGKGDRVVAFDGAGRESEAEIVGAAKGSVELKSLMVNQTPRPPATLTLGQAIPKGKNMDLIIQKATELGASFIVPLLSERTVVRLDQDDLRKKQRKWQRVAIEACKQSGQNWLPVVSLPATIDQFVKTTTDAFRLVAAISSEAQSLKAILAEWDDEHGARPREATLMVGPEGDFTPAEVSKALAAGFAPLSLGPIILRSETAAIYALGIAGYELREG
ncbi:MAG: 16S rRNA (uracil(1498)-N(3))-methyltransferase [Verrucomicrobiales bacterium]